MEGSENNDQEAKGTIKAIGNLVDKVPIYEDAVQPLAKETGKALGTAGKAVKPHWHQSAASYGEWSRLKTS